MLFTDRRDAGRRLAPLLEELRGRSDLFVLGLPRGGVPVAYEVALSLGAPLDVYVVRKLGLPGREELAMGAIASGGVLVLNRDVTEPLGIPPAVIERVVRAEAEELTRREQACRGGRPPLDVRNRTVVVVDDGLATGSTMRAAVAGLGARGTASIVVAVPVGARATCAELLELADQVVCAYTPEPFGGVGIWYDDFTQTTDEEVRELLERAAEERVSAPASSRP